MGARVRLSELAHDLASNLLDNNDHGKGHHEEDRMVSNTTLDHIGIGDYSYADTDFLDPREPQHGKKIHYGFAGGERECTDPIL